MSNRVPCLQLRPGQLLSQGEIDETRVEDTLLEKLAPSAPPLPALVTSYPAAGESNLNVFLARNEKPQIGLCGCLPYSRTETKPAHSELIQLLSGPATLSRPGGTSAAKAGGTQVVSANAECR